jgi:hypothetical protein
MRKGSRRCIEDCVGGITVRGVVSPDCRKIKILLAGEEGPVSAGAIDLSTDIPVFHFAGRSVSLLGEPDLRPRLAGAPLWFDFLEKVALQLPEPYRGRLEQVRAVLISLLLKEGSAD